MTVDPVELKKIIREQYIRCAKDPAFFMTKFCYIQHPDRGKIRFDLFEYQKNTLHEFLDHPMNIVLKGRQIGISTLVAGYCLWLMLFHEDKNILVISIDQATAKNLVTKVKVMNQFLPTWLRRELTEDNKLTLRFTNGSQIKAVARSKDAGRSESLSLLILDEAAFIDEAELIWAAASPAISTGNCKAILLSTPNGQGNFFHNTWKKAESGENGINPIILDWRVHPERDQAWRDRQTEIQGEVLAAQEHDASFIFSGNTVIKPELIEYYKVTYVQEPVQKIGFDGNLWVWEYPQSGKTYIVSADVARGDASDFSAFHILDAESMNQVAEYKGKLPPREFGDMLVGIATQYNDALVIPDNSSIGNTTVQQIIDRGYKNLFYMSKDFQVVDVHHQYTNLYAREEKRLIPGFTISAKTRPLIIAKLDEYMRDKAVVIRSLRTINELETFIWKNGKAEALSNADAHDDLVLALCLGLWVRDTALRLKNERTDLARMSGDLFMSHMMPFVVNNHTEAQKSYQMETDKGIEDLKWLLG